MDDQQFQKLVAEALDSLPDEIAKSMSNVDVVIEQAPDPDEFEDDALELLGLYEGIPLTERDSDYSGVLPDRITLFKENLVRVATDPAAIREEVRKTVIHEVAHHFGIDDDRLTELGWA